MPEKVEAKDAATAAARKPAALAALFWAFFKIGGFTFGGGWAMVPLIRKELVSRKSWMEDAEFVDLLAIAQSAPGPIAINTAVITGYKIRRFPGALVSALGAALPSFLVILAFATVLLRFKGSQAVDAVFKGMRPAIFGLLVSAVWQIGKTSVKTRTDAIFAVVAVILLLVLKINPVAVIGIAALAGTVIGRLKAGRGGPQDEAQEKANPGED